MAGSRNVPRLATKVPSPVPSEPPPESEIVSLGWRWIFNSCFYYFDFARYERKRIIR